MSNRQTPRRKKSRVENQRRSFLTSMWEGIFGTRAQLPNKKRKFALESLESRQLLAVAQVGAPVSFEDTLSTSFTADPGNDRLLVVSLAYGSGSVTGITFNGNPLTEGAADDDSGHGAEIWYQTLGSNVSPTTAGIVISGSGIGSSLSASAVVYSGVDQGTPVSNAVIDPVAGTNNYGTAPPFDVSSASGDLVVDALFTQILNLASDNLTVGPGQTALFNDSSMGGNGLQDAGFSSEPGAATVTMSWTNPGLAQFHSHAALNIRQVTATPSFLSVNDLSVSENGTATFTVTLTGATALPVTVNYATADGTAVATSGGPGTPDYTATTGTLTFPSSASATQTMTVTVPLVNDTTNEATETFLLNLSGATNATITDAQGVGTITNDDPVPAFSVSDVTVTEGDAGTVFATFNVTLSAASGQTTTVFAETADGTAKDALGDFGAGNVLLTFNPGNTSIGVIVQVTGDMMLETDETFSLVLSNPTNSTIADGTGTGTITNDDIASTFNATVAGDYRVVLNGTHIEIYRGAFPGTLITAGLATAPLTINGTAFSDTLTVDYSGGSLPVITFNGGAGANDTLAIIGGSTTSQTYNFTNENDGSVVLAGAINGTINYTGLEPVSSTINATNVILNYGAASETITISQNGAQTQVDSNIGGETVSFANPTLLLEINAGGGDDSVLVNGFGGGALGAATLDIDGEAGANDSINLADTGAISLGGPLVATAESIVQSNGLTVTGTTTLTAGASGTITLNNLANDFIGDVRVVSALNTILRDANAFQFGAASNISGLLTLTAAGHVTDGAAGTVVVSGVATFNLSGFNLAFDNAGNNLNQVIVQAANATFQDTGDFFFDDATGGSVTSNVTGALTVNTSGGQIGQADPVVVGGVATFNTNSTQNVTLNNPSNNFQSTVNASGDSIALRDINSITVGTITGNTGTIAVTAGGSILDDLDDATRLSAPVVSLNAVNTIGAPLTLTTEDIDTDSNTITASTSGVGANNGIWISDVGGVDFNNISTQDGVIVLDAAAASSATLISAGGTGRNVRVRTAGGALGVASVSAASDLVRLEATVGTIVDLNGGTNNVTALGLVLVGGNGVATAGDPLETTITNLAGTGGMGGFFVTNTGATTITTVNAFGSVTGIQSTTGAVTVVALSPLTIAANVVAGGNITLTATDSAAVGDDLTVNAGITVQSTGGSVTLNAGDNLLLDGTSTVQAATTLALNLDAGDADGDGELGFLFGNMIGTTITVTDSADSNLIAIDNNGMLFGDLLGTVDNVQGPLTINAGGGAGDILALDDGGDASADGAIVITATGAGAGVITGLTASSITLAGYALGALVDMQLSDDGAAGDTITITPNANIRYNVDANNPNSTATPDTLIYDGNGTKDITGPFNGSITGVGVQPVDFFSFEDVRTTAGNLLSDSLNLAVIAGGQDGNPNQVVLTLDPTGTFFDILIDTNTGDASPAVLFSRQLAASVTAMTVLGGTDADTLILRANVAGQLPQLTGVATGGHGNTAFLGPDAAAFVNAAFNKNIGLHFDGGANADTLRVELGAAEDVAYFSDQVDTANSGVVSIAGEVNLSFENLSPLVVVGAGGSYLVDASANASVTTMNILDIGGADGVSRVDGDGTFEDTDFSGFATVTVRSGPGADTITLISVDGAAPVAPGVALTTLNLDTDDIGNTDASVDSIFVLSLPATVTANLFGGAGGDSFTIGSDNTNQDVLGQVNVSNSADEASPGDLLAVSSFLDLVALNVTVTTNTIEGITAFAGAPDIQYGGGDQIETIQLFTTNTLGDTVNVQSTLLGSLYQIDVGGGADTINIASDAPTNTGNLNGINGAIQIDAGAGIDTLNVSDLGDAAGDNYILDLNGGPGQTRLRFTNGAAADDIQYNVPLFANGLLENFNLLTSNAGVDTLQIDATTATTQTNIQSGGGNDTWAINGDALSATNLFQGNADNDDFVLNITNNIGDAAFAAIVSVQIEGNATAGGNNNRDRLTINDNLGATAVRDLNYDYLDTAGDVDILANVNGLGLFGANAGGGLALNVRTMETMIFNGDVANDDNVIVTGTSNDDDLTVALRNNNSSAFVFLNGAPYTSTAPDSLAASMPGVAGGGTGPDMLLNGIGANGIQLDGSGSNAIGNRAIVQAASENDVTTPGGVADIDVFNLGTNGRLIPGFGIGLAYDTISVNQFSFVPVPPFLIGGPNSVVVLNNTFGLLVPVTLLNAGSFVNGALPSSRAGLIVNGGDEANPQATGISDDFFATAHPLFNIAVNGNLPTAGPVGPDGLPIGDQLNLFSLTSFNIFSDKATPPNVSIVAGNGPFGVVASSIERTLLNPGNGVVNVIGDNNNPAAASNQNDNYVVRGRDVDGIAADAGFQEMTLSINGSAPLMINGVQYLKLYGDDWTASFDPAMLNTNDNSVDTLDYRAFADNTPRGWGVDTLFNEGGPAGADGAQADLIIFHTAMGMSAPPDVFGAGTVSENIVVQPSGPDNGEIRSTNATGGSLISVISYVNNTDIIFIDDDGTPGNGGLGNPALSDDDTLTLQGTNPNTPQASGNDTFNVNLNAAGDVANPLVTVSDGGTLLYRVRNFTGFNTLNIAGLGGRDAVSVIGRDDGAVALAIDGGVDTLIDTVTYTGTVNADDLLQVGMGPNNDTAITFAQRSAAANFTRTNLTRVDVIAFNGGGGTGNDTLTVFGSDAANNVTVQPTSALAGTVSVDGFPAVNYTALGTGAGGGFSTIDLRSDNFSNGNLDSLSVIGTGGADTYTYTPNSSVSGDLRLAAGGNSVDITTTNFGAFALNAVGGTDALNVAVTNAIITPGAVSGSGRVTATNAGGQGLLPLDYSNVENATVTGGTVVVTGTEQNDTITVSGTGLVTVANAGGVVLQSYDLTGAANIVINSLDGDDTINISGTFAGGITVIGGSNGNGSDTLNVSGAAVTVNLGSSQITGVVGGPISFTGIEHLNVNGADGVLNAFTVTSYGSPNGLLTLNLNGGDLDNNDADTIDISMTAGPDLLTYTPLSATTALITRGTGGPTINVAGFNDADNNLSVDAGGNLDHVVVNAPVGNDRIEVIGDGLGVRATVFAGGNPAAGVKWVPIDFGSVNNLKVDGGAGDDLLDVINDGPGAFANLVTLTSGIDFAGGDGRDTLRMRGLTAMTATSYTAGPAVGAGRVTHTNGVGTLNVNFTGLEPVIDIVASALHTINANNAANAISYYAGTNSGAPIVFGLLTGEVGIDNLETNEFAAKTRVDINGLGGSDAFSINNSTSPALLTDLRVNGGDPTASGDTLSINGVNALVTVATATSVITGATGVAGAVPITYGTLEGMFFTAGPTTTLAVTGSSAYTVNPGAATDTGTILTTTIPIAYNGLVAGRNVRLTGTAAADTLTVNGTDENDALSVNVTGDVLFTGRATIQRGGSLGVLTLNALHGDDTIAAVGGNPYTTINANGGGSDLDDRLTMTAPAAAVTVDIGARTVTGYSATINYTGLANVDVAGVGVTTITGTAGSDDVVVTPLSATSATVVANATNPAVNVTTSASLTINGAAGSDTVRVLGTAAGETITVNGNVITVGAMIPVTSGGEAIRVSGLDGNDTFNVTPATQPIFIDGGNPVGPVGDTLALTVPAGAGTTMYSAGPENDEGGFSFSGAIAPVSFDHIEAIAPVNLTAAGGVLIVCGTNADDDITVVGTAANALTVSVNDGPAIGYTGVTTITVQGKAGDDDIDVTPIAAWGVALTVEGNDPTASDILTVTGTALVDTVIYTPTAFGMGSISVNGVVMNFITTEHVVYSGLGGNDILTMNGTFSDDAYTVSLANGGSGSQRTNLFPSFNYTGANAVTVTGGAGGFDVVTLQGTEGIDTVTSAADVVTVAGQGTLTLGAALDRLDVNTFGSSDSITLNGVTLATVVNAGDGNDTIIGSPQVDIIYGGSGNDVLVGGASVDFEYGEEGNDLFGNATVTPNGVADDAGADFTFGGEGFDNFVWEPGDGADQNNGGGDAADIFRFFGSAAADTFLLRQGGTPTHFNALIGAVVIDNHGIEDVIVDGQGGADSFTVDDLYATEVVSINLNLGAADAAAVDPVTINGRNLADNLLLSSQGGAVSIRGLRYDVNLTNAEATDTLTVNGNEGDDSIVATPSIGGVILLRLNGQDGNDFLHGSSGNDIFDGGAGDDTFVGGGGTDNVGGGAGSSVGDTILVAGTDGADTINLSLSATGQLIATVNGLTTTYANFIGGPIATSGVEQILVQGQAGNDGLTVNSANGAIPILINFDGGNNADLLTLTGGVATADTYAVGPNITEGTSTIVIAGVTQIVRFNALEPVLDLVAGPLTVFATNANNAINYTQGGVVANGLVSIDGFETIEFSNKTTLTINALSGSDAIHFNNPNTPTGLTAITVHGNDPTDSDTLVVNGVGAIVGVDLLNQQITGASGAGGAVPINYTTIEGLTVNANLSTTLSLTNSADYVVNPGAETDAGTILSDGVPVTFSGYDATETLQLTGLGAGSVTVNGTNLNDTFAVTAPTNIQIAGRVLTQAFLLPTATVNSLTGNDTFNVNGANTFGTLNVNGGDPDNADTLNLTNPAAAPATIDFGLSRITGYSPQINYTGLQAINANNVGGQINFNGTTDDDDVVVTVLSASRGVVQANGVAPVVTYDNGAVATVANFDLLAGEDTLIIRGNALTQTFTVNADSVPRGPMGLVLVTPARTVFVDDLNDGTNNGTVSWTANNESLEVRGLEGNDTFNVATGLIPIFVDGGDPIGTTAGDRLNIFAFGNPVTWEAGPESDEGGFKVGGNARVSYDHIEALGAINAACAIIVGTNADDDITIIARDASSHLGADGVQDFTTSVNGAPEILWLNTPQLWVDGVNGDDDIVMRTPAPNNAVWNVLANIAGGPPSAGAPTEGDRFVLETPNQNTMQFTPSASDRGQILVDTGIVANSVGNIAIINLGPFICDCDPLNPPNPDYMSSPGGIEVFQYDGEGDNLAQPPGFGFAAPGSDAIRIVGTAGNDTITHTGGNGNGEGSVRVHPATDTDFLGVDYQNLGPAGLIGITGGTGGTDTLVVNGTGGSDLITVAATSGDVTVNSHLAVRGVHPTMNLTPSIERLVLNGLEGDDSFVINYSLPAIMTQVAVNGGGPSGSDSLTINGAAAAADAFTATLGNQPHDGNVLVGAVNNPYTGVEHLFLNGNGGGVDTLLVNDDGRDNTWRVSSGTVGDLVQVDGRESIDYNNFTNVTLTNVGGTDVFRVEPTNLAFGGSYTGFLAINGDAAAPLDDVLQIVGTSGDDAVTSTATVVTTNGTPVTAGANLIEVRVSTLSGNDRIDLDLALIGTRKYISAGEGDDNIDARGMADATIYGGIGDDVIFGSPLADFIYGDDDFDSGIPGELFQPGGGNDTINADAGDDVVYGGEGNDIITGFTGNDRLFGGDGSDRFIWNNGDNSDIVEGDEGVDVQIVNGAAAGDIFNLRTATNNQTRAFFERTNLVPFTIDMGKVEQVDINGLAGPDVISVRDLYTTDVKEVNVDVGAAADLDTVTVDGRTVSDNVALSALANGVVNIAGLRYDVDVRQLATGDTDTLTFNARSGNDVIVASDNSADDNGDGVIDGLQSIFGTALATVNLLTINGGAGDDFISGLGQFNGDDGNDTLVGNDTGDAVLVSQTMSGGNGNDRLFGGDGDDTLNGNAGEDTFIGGTGADTIDGGADWDAILINGTSARDIIDVNQSAAAALQYEVANFSNAFDGVVGGAGTETDILVLNGGTRTVEEARIDAGSSDDLIRIQNLDALHVDANVNSVTMTVHGGTEFGAGDRLVVVDNGLDDLTIYRKNELDSNGTVTVGPGNTEGFEYAFDGIERVQFVDEAARVINDGGTAVPTNGTNSRLVVFKHDPYEYNDDRYVATHIGANQTVNVDPTIDPGPLANPFGLAGDDDWYRIEAEVTGTLDLQAFFEEIATIPGSGRPGLPNNGNLDIQVYDVDGTLIAGNGPDFGGNNGTGVNPELDVDGDTFAENERIRIPVVQGQIYYLRVFGNSAAGVTAINGYDLTVINVPAPVPFDIELDDFNTTGMPTNPPGQPNNPNSDTGRSQFDNHTYDNTPTFIFRLDDGVLRNDLPGNDANSTPPDEVIPIPFRPGLAQPTLPGYAIAIFDEGSTAPASGNASNTNVRQPLGFATQLENGLYTFTVPAAFALRDGSHFITARVQMIDPSNTDGNTQLAGVQPMTGWSERSTSLEIVVDILPPPVFFGLGANATDGLHPDSDSGVAGSPTALTNEETLVDRVTNDTTPKFWGTAEANAIIRAYIDLNSNNIVDANDIFIGMTVADPLDGSSQYNGSVNGANVAPIGQWELTSVVNMNDPAVLTALGQAGVIDGRRHIIVTAEDLAGNISLAPQQALDIFIDTQGPQVTDVDINSLLSTYDLFDPKPSVLEPTPLTSSLVISIRDLPSRDALFLYQALQRDTGAAVDLPVEAVGNYRVTGDANGIMPIRSITWTSDGNLGTVAADPLLANQPATGYITITFGEPGTVTPFYLPDDRYTLTISDNLVDPAGNNLDGESHLAEPHDAPTLPSGDGQPGGSFSARFTIDTRPEIGTWNSSAVYVDTNGNFLYDTTNLDFTNRDIQYSVRHLTSLDKFQVSDDIFAGKFEAGNKAAASRFDTLASYGQDPSGKFRFLIDTNNDGVAELKAVQPANRQIPGLPVAGNFDGNALNGDEVGVFAGTTWYLDTNHDFVLDAPIASPLRGVPVSGDFDGDGRDDLAAWTDDKFTIDLASNGFGNLDGTIEFGFIGARERPIAADMDMDGIDDLGLFVPDRAAQNPQRSADWYFLISNQLNATAVQKAALVGTINALNHPFTPVPFGADIHAIFGDEYSLPIVGNFDPPLTQDSGSGSLSHTNSVNPLDVNANGSVEPLDALNVINALNSRGAGPLGAATGAAPFLDVDGDNNLSPLDALRIINYLNARGSSEGAGEGEGAEGEGDVEAMPVIAAVVSAAPSATLESLDFQVSTLENSVARATTDVLAPANSLTSAVKLDSSSSLVARTLASKAKDAEAVAAKVVADLFADDSLDEVLASIADDVSESQAASNHDNIFARL